MTEAPAAEALASVRLSLGRGTTEAEVDQAAAELYRAFTSLCKDPRTCS